MTDLRGNMATRHNERLAGSTKWTALSVAVALVSALSWTAVPVSGLELLDRVIAVVSGTVITMSDARAAIQFGLVDTRGEKDTVAVAMQWLVDRQLVLDELNRYETPDSDTEQINAMQAEVLKRLASGPGVEAALAALGFDSEEARRFVRDSVRVQDYLRRRFESISPGTEVELLAFYAANPGRFTSGGRQLTFDEARGTVEQQFQESRRIQAVDAWLARLRRRADVNELYVPIR